MSQIPLTDAEIRRILEEKRAELSRAEPEAIEAGIMRQYRHLPRVAALGNCTDGPHPAQLKARLGSADAPELPFCARCFARRMAEGTRRAREGG